MINGIKVADMDTHVDPNLTVLEKYVEPSFRPRLPELEPYKLVRRNIRRGPGDEPVSAVGLSMGALPYNRWPGTKLEAGHQAAGAPGQAGARAGTVSMHRGPVTPGVEDENSEGRLIDMDLEGRDLDFIFPGTWASSLTGIYDKDVTLAEGMYRAYHNYMDAYTSVAPERMKSSLQVPGSDPEWAISEIKKWANSKWVAAVWIHLPPGLPVDDPDLDPVFAVMNDLDLPLVHHSFFMEPPYFPGYQDIWGNSVVARTAAHPWGAARLCAYLILSGLFDKYPNLRAAVSEVGTRLAAQLGDTPGLQQELRAGANARPQVHAHRIRSDGTVPVRRRAVRGAADDRGLREYPGRRLPHAPVRLPPRPGVVPRDGQRGHGVGLLGQIQPGSPAEAHVRQRRQLPAHDVEDFSTRSISTLSCTSTQARPIRLPPKSLDPTPAAATASSF